MTGQIINPAMSELFGLGLFLIDGTRVVNLLTYHISISEALVSCPILQEVHLNFQGNVQVTKRHE